MAASHHRSGGILDPERGIGEAWGPRSARLPAVHECQRMCARRGQVMQERSSSMNGSCEKVSAFVISYNRAAIIGTCLRALRFADEVIVVDKSSTDRSEE